MWEALPSVVVVGGQVEFLINPFIYSFYFFAFFLICYFFSLENRALGNLQFWRALSGGISYLVDLWDKVEDKYVVSTLIFVIIVALWGSTGIVSAIDRLPLIPVILELVGIGYSLHHVVCIQPYFQTRQGCSVSENKRHIQRNNREQLRMMLR
ncbi:uncharacterized protein LOC120210960 isoform X1 [Hibiscus syriacus]|uniref:uncharacterized protein LOC120210960 isoform X1 n=1 Tax=Hibiscus syriacus TaxID=106335 RepID=UPI001924434B|nr:uncharacterized protein LOC120210960 isoform X1 [Hibiscus syriacus]XP_039065533.1 uncharacterized protein LOC120210960 isoform X1 [Hibiscus syriacus]